MRHAGDTPALPTALGRLVIFRRIPHIVFVAALIGLAGAEPARAGSDRAHMLVSARVVARCSVGVPHRGSRDPVRPGETMSVPRLECSSTQPVRVTVRDLPFDGDGDADIAGRLTRALAVQVDTLPVGDRTAEGSSDRGRQSLIRVVTVVY